MTDLNGYEIASSLLTAMTRWNVSSLAKDRELSSGHGLWTIDYGLISGYEPSTMN
ncbi:MAG TPA: hypothetical protein VGN20_01055 [Mucilaginibacter sp.]|jgi:hypothetical protein